jgi:hypothetical protein
MKTLIAATAAFMLSAFAASAANAQWVAYAVNDYGVAAAHGNDEHVTRAEAIEACERKTSRTCYDEQPYAISIRKDSWYIVAVKCGGRRAVGGSEYGFSEAKGVAAGKIGKNPNSCTITHQE